MSAFPKETIKNIGESLGVTNLKDSEASALAQDVEYRVNELIQEATKFMRHSKRSKLSVEDINAALRVKNVEPLYGYTYGNAPRFVRTSFNNSDIYYAEEEEVDFDTIINKPLPKIPHPVSFTAHWLAIEGVQPAIPQNPTPSDAKTDLLSKRTQNTKQQVVTNGITSDQVDVKPLVKHVLSKELQMYFETITETVLCDDERLRSKAFFSLWKDPGIHQLLPYFVQHIAKKVKQNLKNLDVHEAMLSMSHSLLKSEEVFIELYLHQLIPPIMTCLVGRNICEDPLEQDHWATRRRAASLIADICRQYGKTYHTLQPRITKTLLRAFLNSVHLTTQYGAIVCLDCLGPTVTRTLVAPNVKFYIEKSPAMKGDAAETSPLRALEIQKCQDALLEVLGHIAEAGPVDNTITDSAGSETRMDVDATRASPEEQEELIQLLGETIGKPFLERYDLQTQVRSVIESARSI